MIEIGAVPGKGASWSLRHWSLHFQERRALATCSPRFMVLSRLELHGLESTTQNTESLELQHERFFYREIPHRGWPRT